MILVDYTGDKPKVEIVEKGAGSPKKEKKVGNKVKVHRRYKNRQGIPIPGVTTILNLLAKPALIHWAWKEGIEGRDYQKVRDRAGNIGTLAHYLIECSIKGMKPDVSEYSPANLEKAKNAYQAWLKWKKNFGDIETVTSEAPLICDTFGGMLDWVIKQNNNHILVDFKTSKYIFFEMICQLAAYKYLWNTNNPDKEIKTCYILRIGKEDGEFEQRRYTDLEKELKLFLHLRDIYFLKREMGNK